MMPQFHNQSQHNYDSMDSLIETYETKEENNMKEARKDIMIGAAVMLLIAIGLTYVSMQGKTNQEVIMAWCATILAALSCFWLGKEITLQSMQ